MPLRHSIKEVVLESGAKGLVVTIPGSTIISSTIHFRAGNDYAKRPEIQQVAHLMEHMAFGPNQQYKSMEEFSQEFSKNGAYSNASTFDTNMHYYADCAQFEWERILDLQELAITKPTFYEEILAAEKGNVFEELSGQSSNSFRVLWQQIGRAFGSRSFLDAEKIKTIDAVTVDDIKEHHARTHTHKNMRFVIAGDFTDKIDHISSKLSRWELPSGERFAARQETLHSGDPVTIVRSDQKTTNFGIAMVIPRILSDFDLLVGSAVTHFLTGTFHSRIFGKARSRGICYAMSSNISADLTGISNWEFTGQTSLAKIPELIALIIHEIRRVMRGDITDDELAAIKQYLLGDYQMRGQTVSSIGGWYASDYFFDDRFEDIMTYPKQIEAISRDDIVRLVTEFVRAGVWTIGEAGVVDASKTEQHRAALEKLFDI